MLLTRSQLAESLSQLSEGDYDLLNEIITDYVDKLNDKEFDDYEQFVNNNLNEIMH